MNPSRRRILRFGAVSLGGGALLSAIGGRPVMAAEAWEANGVTISNGLGEVKALEVNVNDLDIDFQWQGINNASDDVSISLGVRLGDGDYDVVAEGAISLDGKSSGRKSTDDGPVVTWQTGVDDGTIDLLSAEGVSASALSVDEPGATESYDLGFQLQFEHTDADALATATTSVTVENTAVIIDDFEDGEFSEYAGETGRYDVQSSVVSHGANALHAAIGSNSGVSTTSGLNAMPSRGDVFRGRMRIASGSRRMYFYFCTNQGGDQPPNYYRAGISNENDNIHLMRRDNSDAQYWEKASVDVPTDEWVELEVDFDSDGSGDIVVTLYDLDGNQLAQVTRNDTTYDSGGFGYLAETNSSGEEFWFDYVRIVNR